MKKRMYLRMAKDRFSDNWISSGCWYFRASRRVETRIVKREFESMVEEIYKRNRWFNNFVMADELFQIITVKGGKKQNARQRKVYQENQEKL